MSAALYQAVFELYTPLPVSRCFVILYRPSSRDWAIGLPVMPVSYSKEMCLVSTAGSRRRAKHCAKHADKSQKSGIRDEVYKRMELTQKYTTTRA